MESVKLQVQVLRGQLDTLIKDVNSIKNTTIKVDASGLQAVNSLSSGFNNAAKAASNLAKEVEVSVDGTLKKTITVVNEGIGKTRQTMVEIRKDANVTTETITTDYDKMAKAAERAAERARKAQEAKTQALIKAARAEEDRQDREAAAQEKAFVRMKQQILRFEQQQDAADERAAASAERAAERRVASAERAATAVEREQARERAAIEQTERASTSLEKQFNNLARSIQGLEKQYPAGTFDSVTDGVDRAKRSLGLLNQLWADGEITSAEYQTGVRNLRNVYDGLSGDTSRLRTETQKLDKVTESLWTNIQKFARWYIIGNVFTKIISSFKDALSVMKDVDSELANIQKVTDRTDAEMQKLAKSAYSVASSYGVAATDYLQSVSAFAKAGYDDMSESLAELATKTQLVGDVTSDVANQFLISVDAAWKMNGNISALSKTLDAANTIENNYATSIQKLAEGMPIVASVAAQAGMSVEQTMAMLGTITSVTQESGTKSATAARALILNILGQAGDYGDFEVTAESIESVSDALKRYAPEAVKAAEAAGKVINPMEAIAALSKAAEEGVLNEAQLFDILSGLGGKLRTNQLTALVENFGTFNEMLQMAEKNAGSADAELEVMLGTWESKTKILSNTWTEFVSNTVDSGLIKWFLDATTAVVDFGDNIGLTVIAIGGLLTIFKGSEITKGLGKLKDTIKDIPNLFKSGATWMQRFSAATTVIGALTTAISVAVMAYRSFKEAQAEAIAASAESADKLTQEIDKFDKLSNRIETEGNSRASLNEIISQTNSEYSDEAERISDINELREASISLIEEERRAAAQAYVDENKGAYTIAKERILPNEGIQLSTAQAAVSAYSNQYEREGELNWFDMLNLTLAQSKVEKLTPVVEDARKTVEAYELALSILDGTYKPVIEDTETLESTAKETGKQVQTLADKLKTTSENADAMDTAISAVSGAMGDYGAGSYQVYEAMLALEEAIPGSTAQLYDFETGALKVDAALIADKASLLDLIETNRTVNLQNTISELERLRDAAMETMAATMAAVPLEMQGAAQELTNLTLTAYNTRIADARKALSGIQELFKTIGSRSSYTPESTSTSSSSKTTDTVKESHENTIKLLKSELEIMEKQDASAEDRIAKMKAIQNALHEEAEYLRSIGADQVEINSLSSEWLDIQKDIDELLKGEDELDELKGNLSLLKSELEIMEKQGASAEDRIAKMKAIQNALHEEAEYLRSIGADQVEINALSSEWLDWQKKIQNITEETLKTQQELFDSLKATIDDYYNKVVSDKEKELALEEKILAVQKAQEALAKAQSERNVRYYNAATGQWEWAANAKNVKSAQDALDKAKQALTEYNTTQAQAEFKSAWDYVADQIKSGAMTFKEAYDYMYRAMLGIQDKYGVDLGLTLEDSIGGFRNINSGIDGLTKEVADSLGASVGVLYEKLQNYESAVGDFKDAFDKVSEKVSSGDLSIDKAFSYLRESAKEISEKYGIDMTGALDEAIKSFNKLDEALDALPEDASKEFKSAFQTAADKIKNGEFSIDDAYKYLKDRAKDISDKYGIDMTGALDAAVSGLDKTSLSIDELWKQVVITLMRANSVNWWSADETGKAYLHAQNEVLGKTIGATYDSKSGYWYDSNGHRLYDPNDGNPEKPEDNGNGGDGGNPTGGNTGGGGGGTPVKSGGTITHTPQDLANGNYTPTGETVTIGGYTFDTGMFSGNGFYWKGGELYSTETGGKVTSSVMDAIYKLSLKYPDDDLGVLASKLAANMYNGATYDQGGVLRGMGGIKATKEDEMILPPDITKALLSPLSDSLVRGRLDLMRDVLVNRPSAAAINRTSIGTQNNGGIYNIGGISLSEAQARCTTVFELAQLAKNLGISNSKN